MTVIRDTNHTECLASFTTGLISIAQAASEDHDFQTVAITAKSLPDKDTKAIATTAVDPVQSLQNCSVSPIVSPFYSHAPLN